MAFPIVNGMRAIEFGSKGENRSHLNSLVLDANKRATAGHFKYDYEAEGEPLEYVGEKLAMLDNDGNAVATLLITRQPQNRDNTKAPDCSGAFSLSHL